MKSISKIEKLKADLAAAEKEQQELEKAEREEYVKLRDTTIINLCVKASGLSEMLHAFNDIAFKSMQQQQEALSKYGKMRKNSKGGFMLTTEDGEFRVKYAYNSESYYDERADKAAELLKDFINDFIKKKDKGAAAMIMDLLARNNKGQLEYGRISKLYQREKDYTDPRWTEAIQLFKESYQQRDSKYMLYFYKRNSKNEYEMINLNFSSI